MVLRTFGRRGLAERIREHVRIAGVFRSLVEADPRFEIVAPSPLSVVCFRLKGGDDARNQRLLDEANATGEVYLSHTRLRGHLVLRLAVGNLRTQEPHVRRAFAILSAAAG
jgi:aromatic-L-amino-acid decarboxylase